MNIEKRIFEIPLESAGSVAGPCTSAACAAGEWRLREGACSSLASLVEAASDAIVGIDPDGRIRIWNPAAESLFGYPAAEIIGQPVSLLAMPQAGNEQDRTFLEVLAGWRVELPDTTRRRRDGTVANVGMMVSPIRDGHGRVIGASAIIRDISQRKQAEQALRETRERLAVFIEHAPAALAMLDDRMRYIAASRRWNEDYGLGERDLTGLSHYDVFPDLSEYWKRIHRKALDGEVQRGAEDRYERPGFAIQWISWEARPWRASDGKVGGILLFNENVTERRLARERILELNADLERRVETRTAELKESRDYQRLLFETSPTGLALCDLEGKLVDVNPAFLQIVGYTQDEIRRLTYWDLTPVEYEPQEGRQLESLRSSGHYSDYVKEYRRKDGSRVPVRLNGLLITRGDRQYIWSSVEDITERRAVERKMVEARSLAEASARAKTEFLANMSHEIRTPLNAVLGLARMGARECVATSAQAKFSGIVDAGQHLLGVINDVLDFSRLEAGKFTFVDQPYSLQNVLTEAHSFVCAAARQKGLDCTIHLSRDLPDWVRGDAQRVRQILLNLLSNAVKFTERGSVRLVVGRRDSEIVFEVIDTGIGLSAEQASRLFSAFEQADRSTTRRFGGSGLGLAISRELARQMGGDVALASAPGAGSTFTLRLPLLAAERSARKSSTAGACGPRLQGVRVLAAEDVEINRIVLGDLLAVEGALVTIVENGAQAVERVGEGRAGDFDIVLMDIQMPDMDGYEATRRILQAAPGLPVIGLTAHALAEDRERCFAAGMVEHVTKPIEPTALVTVIRRCLPGIPRHSA